MKKIRLTFAAIIAVCWIVCASTNAFANLSGWAAASLDYSSIVLDLGSNVAPDTIYYYTCAGYDFTLAGYGHRGGEAWDQTNGSGSAIETFIEMNTDNWAWAKIDTAEDDYKDIVYAGVSIDMPGTTMMSANAEYIIEFIAAQAGTATISIDYNLEYDLENDLENDTIIKEGSGSGASVFIQGNMWDSGLNSDGAMIYFDLYNGMSQYLSDLGTLTHTFSYSEGELVWIIMGAYAYTDVAYAVPVPGAGLLMSTGLIALAAIRRKS